MSEQSVDVDKRAQLCREVFKKAYGRVLLDQKATADLNAYNRINSAISINKGVTLGLAPVVGLGLYAHIWKAKPTDITKHKQVGAGLLALCVLTNSAAMYYSGQKAPLEDKIIEKYIWPLPTEVLESYSKNHRFPNAKR